MAESDGTIRGDSRVLTFQDLERSQDRPALVMDAIRRHCGSRAYRTARAADEYDRQRNVTVRRYVQTIFDLTGSRLVDFTASNSRIASNFFHRLNTQRCLYSLGQGVSFIGPEDGGEDATKEMLGPHFDRDLIDLAYRALIHGVSFGFWNLDRLHVFPLTEFVPFWDEREGTLRAGARFWRLDPSRPMQAVLYEEGGYTRFESRQDGSDSSTERLVMVEGPRPYKERVQWTEAGGEEVVASENYSALPVVPMWGSRLHQSTLVGMRAAIDSYDLIRSGFANDLSDCAQIYWTISNAGGMTDTDLRRFMDRLRLMHVAVVDADEGQAATPSVQEPPYAARKQYLDDIRAQIYEDFGALDVHTVAAGATNDHIDAAYQPMDEEASDFEQQVSEFVQQVLSLMGVDDRPVFHRSRISNQAEQVSMVVQEAQWLDQETILRKLPNVRPDEVPGILDRLAEEEQDRMGVAQSIADGSFARQAQGGSATVEVEETETVEEEEV